MSEDALFVIAAFEFEDEAHVAKGHLDAEGIEAFILGSDNSGFGGLSADATYQVVVKQNDQERAQQILEESESDEGDVAVPAWNCEGGEDVDEGFAICWSCGSHWPGANDETPA